MSSSRNPNQAWVSQSFSDHNMCLLITSGFPIIFLVLGHYDFVNLMEMILLVFFMFLSARGMAEKEDGTSQTARAWEKWNIHLSSLIDNFFLKMFILIFDVSTLMNSLISSGVNFTPILVYISLLDLIAYKSFCVNLFVSGSVCCFDNKATLELKFYLT